jgi:hypothetical protein
MVRGWRGRYCCEDFCQNRRKEEGKGKRTFRSSRISATEGHITSNHQAGPCSIALFFPNRFSSALAVLISPLNFFVAPAATFALGPLLVVAAPGVTAGVTAGVAIPSSASSGGVSKASAFVGK